jgi:hypothetical protein
MASTISAGTTSGTAIAISGDTSGNLAFQTQAGANTITVPNASGVAMVSGNMPTFYAYNSAGSQTVTAATFTKINLATEVWDTNNNFASSRFTPTVAGYYQLNGSFSVETVGTVTRFMISLYKNGSEYIRGIDSISTGNVVTASVIVSMNGTTDYIELYGWVNGAGTLGFRGGSDANIYTYFQGCLLRAS